MQSSKITKALHILTDQAIKTKRHIAIEVLQIKFSVKRTAFRIL